MRGKTGKEYIDSILDEQEQTYVNNFVENENMFQSVRKVLLAGLYEQGVITRENRQVDSLSNFALALVSNRMDLSNEELGSDLRACWQAINMVELALENLSKYKKQSIPEKKGNDAL